MDLVSKCSLDRSYLSWKLSQPHEVRLKAQAHPARIDFHAAGISILFGKFTACHIKNLENIRLRDASYHLYTIPSELNARLNCKRHAIANLSGYLSYFIDLAGIIAL